jgi:hypothetical protein
MKSLLEALGREIVALNLKNVVELAATCRYN